MNSIYLDYCSTTPIDPAVAEVIRDYHLRGYANPASQHRPGQAARRELERLRHDMLERLGGCARGMQQDRLLITSGGTESNHLAVLGLWRPERPVILVSDTEHSGVHGAARLAAQRGATIRRLPVDRNGLLRLDQLRLSLQDPGVGLVCLMLVNHETGVVQPVAEAARVCREQGVLLHCDAVQAIGRVTVDFSQLGVDSLSFAAHKFYGPRGVGGLIVRQGLEPSPLMAGGSQQMGLRPGTEDVALAAGMQVALANSLGQQPESSARLTELRDAFEQEIRAALPDLATILSGAVARSGHVSCVAFRGVNRQALLLAADLAGLAISTGSACASGSSEPSPVLVSMGLESELIEGALRISFGKSSTMEDVREAVVRLTRIVRVLEPPKTGSGD